MTKVEKEFSNINLEDMTNDEIAELAGMIINEMQTESTAIEKLIEQIESCDDLGELAACFDDAYQDRKDK